MNVSAVTGAQRKKTCERPRTVSDGQAEGQADGGPARAVCSSSPLARGWCWPSLISLPRASLCCASMQRRQTVGLRRMADGMASPQPSDRCAPMRPVHSGPVTAVDAPDCDGATPSRLPSVAAGEDNNARNTARTPSHRTSLRSALRAGQRSAPVGARGTFQRSSARVLSDER